MVGHFSQDTRGSGVAIRVGRGSSIPLSKVVFLFSAIIQGPFDAKPEHASSV